MRATWAASMESNPDATSHTWNVRMDGWRARPAGGQAVAPIPAINSRCRMRHSKVRLVRCRDLEELRVVLRANLLVHRLLNPIVALHHGPRPVERIRIVKRDVHLHRLAAIDQSKALDNVQLLAMWRPEIIDERLFIEPDRIDHERIAFVVADRLAIPGRLPIGRMGYVEIDMPDLLIIRIDHYDFLRRLDEVERLEAVQMKSGNARRHAERMRRKGKFSGQNLRVVLLHALHDPGLENAGAGEIGNKVVRLLPGSSRLLIADPRMGGIVMEGTRYAGHYGKIYVEREPPDV